MAGILSRNVEEIYGAGTTTIFSRISVSKFMMKSHWELGQGLRCTSSFLVPVV